MQYIIPLEERYSNWLYIIRDMISPKKVILYEYWLITSPHIWPLLLYIVSLMNYILQLLKSVIYTHPVDPKIFISLTIFLIFFVHLLWDVKCKLNCLRNIFKLSMKFLMIIILLLHISLSNKLYIPMLYNVILLASCTKSVQKSVLTSAYLYEK